MHRCHRPTKKRDALFVSFPSDDPDTFFDEHWPCRAELIDWLEAHHIGWMPYDDIANPNVMEPYQGHIYLDVPFNETDPTYQQLAQHLEHADGTGRIDGVRFYVITLDTALQNAEHDKPGFWEDWAANF